MIDRYAGRRYSGGIDGTVTQYGETREYEGRAFEVIWHPDDTAPSLLGQRAIVAHPDAVSIGVPHGLRGRHRTPAGWSAGAE